MDYVSMKTNFEIKKNKQNDADKNQNSVIVDKKERSYRGKNLKNLLVVQAQLVHL